MPDEFGFLLGVGGIKLAADVMRFVLDRRHEVVEARHDREGKEGRDAVA